MSEETKLPVESEYLAARDDIVQRVLDSQPADEYLYDLAQLLGISQSAVSHQLKILKDAKLVKFRREGKIIFYMLDDDHVRTMLSMGMEHVEE